MVAQNHPPRLIALKFSMNEEAIPYSIKKLRQEEYREVKFRHGATGTKLIEAPVPSVSLTEFVTIPAMLGYVFSGAAYERRPDPSGGKKVYHTACYYFALRDYSSPSEEFKGSEYSLRDELELLCADAWTVRAMWDNPFYGDDGCEIPGIRAMEINLNGRLPLTDEHGAPVLQWNNKSLKDFKVPLKAKNKLVFADNIARIVPA